MDPKHTPDPSRPLNEIPSEAARVHYGPPGGTKMLHAAESPADHPVAMLICHGMGQQVRYETISSVAKAIQDEAASHGGVVTPLDVHLFKIDENIYTRAEIAWKDKDEKPHAVHIYEAYWAPLTEGKVTYWDTVKFLLLAGWNGMKY
ncbi:MAG TPA: hypothetical protein VHA06_07155, partial [Candidatus Angelobacter sp.]|nr:hypothetical protein [Candidatus Angelobacter sp.]